MLRIVRLSSTIRARIGAMRACGPPLRTRPTRRRLRLDAARHRRRGAAVPARAAARGGVGAEGDRGCAAASVRNRATVLGQRVGSPRERPARGARLLEHRRVLLRDLVELGHRLVDLDQPLRLLARRARDLADMAGDVGDRGDDALERSTGLADSSTPRLTCVPEAEISAVDLARGLGRALRQRPHLGRHDGKAATRVAGARRLDASVQRQQVGLEGDVVDDADDLRDLPGGVCDLAHRRDRLAHHGPRSLGAAARLVDDAGGLDGALGGRLHRRGQLVERGRRLLQRGRLVLGPRRELGRGLGDAARPRPRSRPSSRPRRACADRSLPRARLKSARRRSYSGANPVSIEVVMSPSDSCSSALPSASTTRAWATAAALRSASVAASAATSSVTSLAIRTQLCDAAVAVRGSGDAAVELSALPFAGQARTARSSFAAGARFASHRALGRVPRATIRARRIAADRAASGLDAEQPCRSSR